MNNRITKKILCCRSGLSKNTKDVLKARKVVKNNIEYFNNKHIYIIPIEDDSYCSLPFNRR